MISAWDPETALKQLDEQCKRSFRSGYRPNTVRNYRSRANIYIHFCLLYSLLPFPTTEWNLIRYERYLANGVTSYDTVKNYLSTVKRFHEIGRLKFPEQLFTLKLEMSIKCELATVVCKAVPITPKILIDVYQQVKLDSPVEVVAYVALLIVFYLFLCRSNLVPETGEKFNCKEQLTRSDIWKLGTLTVVDIHWSKTNQYRQRDLILSLISA